MDGEPPTKRVARETMPVEAAPNQYPTANKTLPATKSRLLHKQTQHQTFKSSLEHLKAQDACSHIKLSQPPESSKASLEQSQETLDTISHIVLLQSLEPPDTRGHVLSQSPETSDPTSHIILSESPDTTSHIILSESPDTTDQIILSQSPEIPDTTSHIILQQSPETPNTTSKILLQQSSDRPDTTSHIILSQSPETTDSTSQIILSQSPDTADNMAHIILQQQSLPETEVELTNSTDTEAVEVMTTEECVEHVVVLLHPDGEEFVGLQQLYPSNQIEAQSEEHQVVTTEVGTSEVKVGELAEGEKLLGNLQIVVDISGKHIVVAGNEEGLLSHLTSKHDQQDTEQQQDAIQLTQDHVSDGPEVGANASPVGYQTNPPPVLFQVRAEDGSFHKVNMEVDCVEQTGAEEEVGDGGTVENDNLVSKDCSPGEDRPFACDLCSATFSRLGNYTRHRMVHTIHMREDYRYKCETCSRMFLQRCDLRRHMLEHEGNLPYKCDHCGKGYVRNSDLVVHLRFHNKERSFPCPQCPKAFYQSGDLQRHIRHVHERIKPLTCGHCQRKYSKEATLIRHMQTVHRDIILKSLTKAIPPTGEGE